VDIWELEGINQNMDRNRSEKKLSPDADGNVPRPGFTTAGGERPTGCREQKPTSS
jgi:hypothetical protein